jgi:hypothetical protein
LIVAPSRLIRLEAVEPLDEAHIRGRRARTFEQQSYGLVQIEKCDAIVLTYSCDIDRGLENIAAGAVPAPVELVTVTAVRPVTPTIESRIDQIRRGGMPRFATIAATNAHPELIVDFSSIQQISLRVLIPCLDARRYSLRQQGQYRLLERMAHALGDVFRTTRHDQAPPDRTLLSRAAEALARTARRIE